MIIPASPAEIKLTKTAPTAEELQAYLDAWLKDAADSSKIANLQKIALALGGPWKYHPCYKGGNRDKVKRYRKGEYTLFNIPYSGTSDANQYYEADMYCLMVLRGGNEGDEFAGDSTIVVKYLDGVVFADVWSRKGPYVPKFLVERQKNNIYLPGEWEQLFFDDLEQAEIKLAADARNIDNRARDKLLEKIGLVNG